MTEAEWMELAGTMVDLWPASKLPPKSAAAWYPLLSDLDAADVAAAFRQLAADPDQRFIPNPGQIRTAVEPDVNYEDALADLRTLLRRHGWYEGRPAIDDPALARFVDAYGWRRLHDIELSDPTFRAQFRDSYRRYVQAVRADRAAGRDVDAVTGPTGQPALDVVPGHTPDDESTSLVPRDAI